MYNLCEKSKGSKVHYGYPIIALCSVQYQYLCIAMCIYILIYIVARP